MNKSINKKNLYKWILGTIGFFIVLYFVALNTIQSEQISDKNFQASSAQYMEIGGQKIKLDLALTEAAQEQGLSGRASLDADQGMFFVFPAPGKYLFWMKDMNFPIDMIWLDQNLKVVYIKEDAEPASYPASFGPTVDAKYVLEVVNGFSKNNNVQTGDQAQLSAQ